MKNYLLTNNIKKIGAFVLTTSVLVGNISPIFANENTLKDEVVYVKLNNAGDVDNVYIVNSFDLKKNEKLIDYGDYTNVVNLSTSDILNYANGLLDMNVSDIDRKFYYQGNVSSNEIPWNIDINYTLDGKSISVEDLAGKNGKLEISIDINKNENIDEIFFNNYALQISLNLDMDKCKNIIVDGGTTANVGSNKAITFIKLAGENANYTITADVEGFEMDSISFNGVNMGMDVDIDTSQMTEPLDELVDAVEQLNNGASELSTGINSTKDGANELYNGISNLESGVNSYKKGVNSLYTNSKQLLEGSKQLDIGLESYESGVSSLYTGTQNLYKGLYQLSQGSAEYKKNISDYTNAVKQITAELKSVVPQDEVEAAKLNAIIAKLEEIANVSQNFAASYEIIDTGINSALDGSNEVNNGTEELSNNISSIRKGSSDLYNGIQAFSNGSSELASGIDEISNGTAGLKNGTNQLVNGVNKLGSGSSVLKDGTSQLNNETSKLPETIDEKINEMTSKYTNSDFKPVSFASENNTNIESVQFAIRTDSIKIKEVEKVKEVEVQKTSMWDKFLNLFKKD